MTNEGSFASYMNLHNMPTRGSHMTNETHSVRKTTL